jgi:hypothetical protein
MIKNRPGVNLSLGEKAGPTSPRRGMGSPGEMLGLYNYFIKKTSQRRGLL